MKNSKKNNAIVFTVKAESREEFFARGKRKAMQIDKGNSIISERIISFEDPNDLIKSLTECKP